MAKKKAAAKAKTVEASPPKKTASGLTIERIALEALHADPANARKHNDRNLEAIRASLAQFGQTRPLVVQASSMRIIAGNGTYAAMRLLGWAHCDAVRVPFSDLQATAYGIADNRTAELAEWDLDALEKLTQSLEQQNVDLRSIGFEPEELDAILGPVAEDSSADDLADDDDAEQDFVVKVRPVELTQEQRDIFSLACVKIRGDFDDGNTSEGQCLEILSNEFLKECD